MNNCLQIIRAKEMPIASDEKSLDFQGKVILRHSEMTDGFEGNFLFKRIFPDSGSCRYNSGEPRDLRLMLRSGMALSRCLTNLRKNYGFNSALIVDTRQVSL